MMPSPLQASQRPPLTLKPDVLEMTAEDATHFFENIPKIKRKLQTLVDVGLGYGSSLLS
jgi:SUMO ligase MMS21 Smc5/6 complex component